MAALTKEEVKRILRIDDDYSEKESVTVSSNEFHRLSYKPVVEIHRVDTDTEWSTESKYSTADYYTTEDYRNYTMIRRIDTGSISTGETVYVSYSYNEYDELIDYFIPIVTRDVCSYLNNYFEDDATEYLIGNFKIYAANTDSYAQIHDTYQAYFERYGLGDDMDIYISGSPRNSGIYTISSGTSEVLKLSSGDSLLQEYSTDMYSGVTLKINRIKWPAELKPIIAYIIWQNISRAKDQNIKSKSLGPSSVTYETLDGGNYPPSIYGGLKKFKKHRLI